MSHGGDRSGPGQKPGIPFEDGPDPRRGGGKKGHSGRPKSEVRELCLEMLQGKRGGYESARKILADPDHKHFAGIFKTVMGYGHGQPEANVNLTGDVPVLRIIRDQAAVQEQMRPVDSDDA